MNNYNEYMKDDEGVLIIPLISVNYRLLVEYLRAAGITPGKKIMDVIDGRR